MQPPTRGLDRLAPEDRESLDRLLAVLEERRRLEERIERLRRERGRVSDAVYARVERDYEARLAAVAERARQLEEEVRAARGRLGELLARRQGEAQAAAFDVEEVELRGRLGELRDDEVEARTSELRRTAEALATEVAELEELAASFPPVAEDAGDGRTPPAAAAAASAAAEESSGDRAAVAAPIEGAEPPAAPPPLPPLPPPQAPAPAMAMLDPAVTVPGAAAPPPLSGAQRTTLFAPEPPRSAAFSGATNLFRPAVLISAEPIGGRTELPLAPLSTIGRSPSSDIRLDHSTVSSRHAEIRLTPEGYRLIDLGSSNGTFVNGERVEQVTLADGDRILVGTCALEFRKPQA